MRPQRLFFTEVESVRGLGALFVLLGHAYSVILPSMEVAIQDQPDAAALIQKIVISFFNANAAVILFFAISGLVLGHALDLREGGSPLTRYAGFVWRRIFRIYPAHIVAALGMALVLVWLYRHTITWTFLLQNIVLTKTEINPLTWTIKVELIAGLIFPLLYVLSRRRMAVVDGLVFVLFLAAAAYFFRLNTYNSFFAAWLCAFYGGLLVTSRGEGFTHFVLSRGLSVDAALGLAYVLLAAPGAFVFAHPIGIAISEACFACVFLSFLVWGPKGRVAAFLSVPFLRWNGRISYSFYLWTLPVSAIVSRFLYAALPAPFPAEHVYVFFLAWLSATACGAWAIGHLSFTWIEKPFIRLGSVMASRLRIGG